MSTDNTHIAVRDLDMAYGSFVIQRDLTFDIRRGEIFIIMGGSGCGKSTLLRHLIGLKSPAAGSVFFDGEDFWGAEPEERTRMSKRFDLSPVERTPRHATCLICSAS